MRATSGLALAVLVALFLWFGWTGGAGNAFDVDAITGLAAWRHAHPQVTSAAIVLTDIGNATVTVTVPLLAGALLWVKRRRGAAVMLVATVLLERAVADSIKFAYDRARPAFDLHPVMTNSSSYPSGHAANATTAFVALALFAAPPAMRRPAVALAIVGGLLIGLTRPYLGVHWPSDVIGGWVLAAMFLLSARAIDQRWSIAHEAQHEIVGGHRAPLGED